MLNDEQKAFILEHQKDISARKIARQLKVNRQEVSRFIEESSKSSTPKSPFKYTKVLVVSSVLALIILHLAIRYNTFWLAHVRGDQNQYVGLAMKIENSGFKGYNLRGIDWRDPDQKGKIYSLIPAKDEEGSLLRGLKQSGSGYYDIPFFHKGPGFPIALMISHYLFSRNSEYLMVNEHLGERVKNLKPKEYFTSQFYAVIVPLFFSLTLMLLTIYLGKMLFSARIGIYAGFLMAVNPISILTSYKLWADDMLSVFVILSVILFIIAQEKDKLGLSLLAGISCGIAVMAKQNGGIIFAGLIAYSVLIKGSIKHLISYGFGLTLLAGPWFYKIYQLYGDLLYSPVNPDIQKTDTTGWFKMIASRPHALKMFSIGIPYQTPPFVLMFITLKKLVCRLRIWNTQEKENEEGGHIVLLWFWIFAFLGVSVFLGGLDEHRRMLPTYPAIAILAAFVLNQLKLLVNKIFNNAFISEIPVLIILITTAFWSIPMGLSVALDGGALIMRPF